MTIEIRLWNDEEMEYKPHSSYEANTISFLTDVNQKVSVDRVSYFEHVKKIIVWGTAVRP